MHSSIVHKFCTLECETHWLMVLCKIALFIPFVKIDIFKDGLHILSATRNNLKVIIFSCGYLQVYNFGIFYSASPQPPKEQEKELEWADEESHVVHLSEDDFDTFMEANPSVLVMFYAPCEFILLFYFKIYDIVLCKTILSVKIYNYML